jgi:hypothetical protein
METLTPNCIWQLTEAFLSNYYNTQMSKAPSPAMVSRNWITSRKLADGTDIADN